MEIYRGADFTAAERTVPAAIASTFDEHPKEAAILFLSDDKVVEIDYRELKSRVERLALGLQSRGLRRGDRCLIMAETRPEWLLADLAILFSGGVTVTAFPTLPFPLFRYHVEDSGSTLLVLEGERQVRMYRQLAKEKPRLEALVMDEVEEETTLGSLLELDPSPRDLERVRREWELLEPGDVASIIYTSGTTGMPKGALLTHWNIASAALSGLQVLHGAPGQTVIAFLPMAHIYQRLVCIGMLMIGGVVAFSTPQGLAENLLRFRPDLMAAVPRVYEKVYKRILEEVERRSRLNQRVYRWAEGVALEISHASSSRERTSLKLRTQHRLANWLVYRRIRKRLGGNLKYAMSGASALPPRLAYIFNGMGVSVPEGYGLTETAAPANLNPPEWIKPGTVGPPVPGVSEMLAEDGEILIKGPNVFVGYQGKPEETKRAFTDDGWLLTGDLGEFDEDGYLRIIGRKKQIIALSTGKKVAPRPIEEALRSSPLVEDCMVLGENRSFTSAILQPQFDRLAEWLESEGISATGDVVRGVGPGGESVIVEVPRRWVERPEVVSLFQRLVEQVNDSLDYHEKIKKFIVLHRSFSREKEEITPTLKKRREVIETHLKDAIEALYT